MLDIFSGVLEILEHVLRVRVEKAGTGCLALLEGHGPGAVLDTGGEIAGKGVLLIDQKVGCTIGMVLLTALVVAKSMSLARAGLSNA